MAAAGKLLEISRSPRWQQALMALGGQIVDDLSVLTVQEHLLEHRMDFGVFSLALDCEEELSGLGPLHLLFVRLPQKPDLAILLRLQRRPFTEPELAYWRHFFGL
jgi:hypothetical protein